MTIKLFITKSSRPQKKYDLLDENKKYILSFGHTAYEDYTIHKEYDRKKRYINRHAKNEDWHKSGIYTAGFWSRWLLWNLPTIKHSLIDINDRFNISVKLI